MHPADLTALVHLAGFLTATLLYGMLGAMTLTRRGARPSTSHSDKIPLVTAALGVTWNVGELIAVSGPAFGVTAPAALEAIAFVAFGFLPAVAVHSASRALPGAATRRVIALAYALATLAGLLQLRAAVIGSQLPSRGALLALTLGYGIVVAILAVDSRRHAGWQRALSVAGLATFAVMAFHLSQRTEPGRSVLVELVGHHASLALALVILYQDYRFALADIFLKRALAVTALVTLLALTYLGFVVPRVLPLAARDADDPRAAGLLLTLWVATALMYPLLRTLADRFVDRVVLQRADYRTVRAVFASRIATLETTRELLDAAIDTLAPALSAGFARAKESSAASPPPVINVEMRDGSELVTALIETTDPPRYEIELGKLSGGRRLLSDDLAMIESVALMVARRLDAVRVTLERVERGTRENEILQLATEAELKALRAQLNPHFLFNALTTVGALMRESPEKALDTLYRLTGLLRAVLRRSDGDFTTLGDELALCESYLAIEATRFEERLRVAVDVPESLLAVQIPPLLLQPIVENAVKHGVAPRRERSSVTITARLEEGAQGAEARTICLSVVDTGAGVSDDQLRRRRASGVGLNNVARRIERYYGQAGSLLVRSSSGEGTTVELRFPVRWGAVVRSPIGV